MATNDSKNNNFSVLHLLAAFFVMYGHQCALMNLPAPILFGSQIQALGVKIIFLISGYLIMRSLLSCQGSTGKVGIIFCIKRLGRLLPELVFVVFISALIIGSCFSSLPLEEYISNKLTWEYIVSNLLLNPVYGLPGVFMDNPYKGAVNGSLWTMPIEVFVYGVFLIVYLVAYNDRMRKISYIIVSGIITGMFLLHIIFWPDARIVFYGTDWMSALKVMPYMMIGGAAYFINVKKENINLQKVILVIMACNAVTFQSLAVREIISLVILPYCVFSLCLCDNQKLKTNFLKGEYAYGIYLWGFPVQQSVIQILYTQESNISFYELFIISVFVTCLLAIISHEMVYIPISKWNRQIISRISETRFR